MAIALIQSVLVGLAGQLTPYQRFDAMRRLETGDHTLLTNKWFVLLGWSMIFILSMLLLVVRRMRIEKEKQQVQQHYDALSEKLGLTAEEREILDAVAARMGLPHKDAVFAESDAFENGLARLMQDVFTDGHNLVYRKKLQVAIFSIRQKLGYAKPAPASQTQSAKLQSSRHIPVGKTVMLSLPGQSPAQRIRADVAANEPYELLLRPEIPLACPVGQIWDVQYEAGSVTWEFEAITLMCSSDGLELNHSEQVRFVNRRRFPRVAVRKAGVIAKLPVFREFQEAHDHRPVFFDTQITEISGPGLRLYTELEAAVGERVLVVFELEQGRAVQDVGIVRDLRQSPLGRAMIVELTGLTDRAVDELVRVTNQLSVLGHQEKKTNAIKHSPAEAVQR